MVAGWDIEPDKVRDLTTAAETHQQTVHQVVRALDNHPSGGGLPGAEAIADFVTSRVPPARWIEDRIGAVVDGTIQVLDAYDHGDLTMAADHQRAAGTIGAPAPTREATQGPLGAREPL